MAKKLNKRIKSFCNTCKLASNQEILFSHEEEFHDPEEGFHASAKWQILKCCGCETVSFRDISWNSEDYDFETKESIPTIRLYPLSEEDALPAKPFMNVPRKIRGIYGETVDAYNRNSRVLCSGGIRAVIEGICGDKSVIDGRVEQKKKGGGVHLVRQKNLNGRVNGLHERGIITSGLRDSLHENRVFGNEALHELDPPAREELSIALSLIEHTLDHVYEVADKLAELRALKRRRKNKGS
jgi:hypothetical protein